MNAVTTNITGIEAMKPEEYRALPPEQLELSLKELQKNLFHLRFQSSTERLETPSEMQKARRDIARILTIKRERERAAQSAGEKGA